MINQGLLLDQLPLSLNRFRGVSLSLTIFMLNRCFVYVFVVLIFLVAIRCTDRISNDEIEKSWCKYGSGLHLGDVLRFDDSNLKGDTIYRNNQPAAIVIACERKVLENSAVLKLKSIHNEKTGTYHEKGLT